MLLENGLYEAYLKGEVDENLKFKEENIIEIIEEFKILEIL